MRLIVQYLLVVRFHCVRRVFCWLFQLRFINALDAYSPIRLANVFSHQTIELLSTTRLLDYRRCVSLDAFDRTCPCDVIRSLAIDQWWVTDWPMDGADRHSWSVRVRMRQGACRLDIKSQYTHTVCRTALHTVSLMNVCSQECQVRTARRPTSVLVYDASTRYLTL